MNKRLHYIDNLRWLTVSILILYHAAIAYNTWGEKNYIFFGNVRPKVVPILVTNGFTPTTLVLSGMCLKVPVITW